jgi:hypothetical protein
MPWGRITFITVRNNTFESPAFIAPDRGSDGTRWVNNLGSWDCKSGITFRGMTSDEVTTTAIVRAVPGLDLATYVDCLDATHRFKRKYGCTCEVDAVDQAWKLVALAGLYPEGTVLERVVDRLVVRRAVEAG